MKSILLILISLLMVVQESFGTNDRNRRIRMRMRMQDVRSTSDFIRTVISDQPAQGVHLQPMERQMFQPDGSAQQGFYQQGVEIMAAVVATPDVCGPRPATVAVPPYSDPRIVCWPACAKVPRCGGCCGLDLLECAPTLVEHTTVLVMKQRIYANDSSRYGNLGNVNVVLETHVACDCHCRIKPTDCNAATQDYDEVSCSCRCRNSHDEATSCPSSMRWDDKHCRCVSVQAPLTPVSVQPRLTSVYVQPRLSVSSSTEAERRNNSCISNSVSCVCSDAVNQTRSTCTAPSTADAVHRFSPHPIIISVNSACIHHHHHFFFSFLPPFSPSLLLSLSLSFFSSLSPSFSPFLSYFPFSSLLFSLHFFPVTTC